MGYIISKAEKYEFEVLERAIEKHGFCIIKKFYEYAPLIEMIREFKKNFSAENDIRTTGPYRYKMPNFQRLDVGDYSQSNARFSRMFPNFTWDKTSPFKSPISKLIEFRNLYLGLNQKNHVYTHKGSKFCDLAKILHYPVGGGFMNKHVDANKDCSVPNVLLSLSKRGVDFKEGGVYYIDKNENFIDAEDILEVGDLYMHSVTTFHGVKAVDAKKNVDLSSLNGRLAINLSFERFVF